MNNTSQPTPEETGAKSAAAQSPTATIGAYMAPTGFGFLPTPGMIGMFKSNFDAQVSRAMMFGDSPNGEVFATAHRIVDGDIESWSVEWAKTAERIEGIAKHCLDGGHLVSARDAFLRADAYWRAAFMFLDYQDQRKQDWYLHHRGTFQSAAKLFNPPIEPMNIPYEHGKTLPGYFVKAREGLEPRPTLMVVGGGDLTCEETFFLGGAAAANQRGYNAFLFEIPGMVGAYALDPELTYRADTEVPIKYAVDYVLSRPDVDPERLALSGHSFGGYFAPRAATVEKRLKAVITYPYFPDCRPNLMRFVGLDPDKPHGRDMESEADLSDPIQRFIVTDFRARFGVKTLAEMYDKLAEFTILGRETWITCPLLNVTAAGEGALWAPESFDKLTCPKTHRRIEGYEGGDLHCALNNLPLKHQIEFDWLEDVLFKK